MATQPLPFGPNQQSGLDQLSSSIQLAVNVIIDQSGAVRRRPGISPYPEAPSTPIDAAGIDGVHVTVGGKVYVAGGSAPARKLYRVAGGVATNLSGTDDAELVGEGRPIWAETEAMVAVTAGSLPQKILLADDSSSRLGGSPPSCSHIIANTARLLANQVIVNKNIVRHSDFASGTATEGHETWIQGPDNFAGEFNVGSRPDPVVAMAENGEEVFTFGTTIMQTHAPSTSEIEPYGSVAFKEHGCSAPYSIVRLDNRFCWLDHRRRFVQSDGRQAEVVSGNIQRTIDEIEDVSDCFGYRLVLGPLDVGVWTFPSDGRSFAFASGAWSQWTSWNDTAATFTKFAVKAAAAHPLTSQNVLGLYDGRLALFDSKVNDDLGRTIPVRIFTGFLDRGTDAIKHCLAVRLVFRRGSQNVGPEPTAILAWRDDEDEWSPGIEIGLGEPGDRNPVVLLRSLGTYRRRQWRIDFDGDSEFVLAAASEEFEVEQEE